MPQNNSSAMSALALNMARVSEELGIVTLERIVDAEDGLLFAAGHKLTQENLQRIAKGELQKPLIDSIRLSHALSAADVFEDLQQQINKSEDLATLVNSTFDTRNVQTLAAFLGQLPRLLDWMTLLQKCYPSLYQQSLFCAITGAVLAFHMGQNKPFQQGAFVAGLCHDLGVLCLHEDVLDNKDDPEKREIYQQHPLLAGLLLQRVEKMPSLIIRATEESHERCDGSGFPNQKSAESLSQLGQVVAMTDLLWDLLTVRLWPQGMTIGHARHILHITSDAHFRNTYEALTKGLSKAQVKSFLVTPEDQLPALLQQSLASVDQLNQCYMSLYAMVTALPRDKPSKLMASCYHSLAAIHRAVNSAGVLTSEHYEWLQELKDSDISPAVGEELETAALFHVALRWELSRLLDNLQHIYHSERKLLKSDVVNLLNVGLQGIKDFQQDRLHNQIGLLLW
ncbi:hypothetical protein NFC81_08855 [Salinispirillum sp. LH 10-3-1]|uniref:HD domain-containing protein n=1 Tax=Salinispirillum sp. LH 10-3-1 TaxID=2952525 RepID=A0AB38YBU2_9GAMM